MKAGPKMRAKMVLQNVDRYDPDYDGDAGCVVLDMSAVAKSGGYSSDGSDENNTFARFTPSADLRMMVNNPDLAPHFEVGQEFYLDFQPITKVEKVDETAA